MNIYQICFFVNMRKNLIKCGSSSHHVLWWCINTYHHMIIVGNILIIWLKRQNKLAEWSSMLSRNLDHHIVFVSDTSKCKSKRWNSDYETHVSYMFKILGIYFKMHDIYWRKFSALNRPLQTAWWIFMWNQMSQKNQNKKGLYSNLILVLVYLNLTLVQPR